jgi:hypothetical protein
MKGQIAAARAKGVIDRDLLFGISARQLLDVFGALDAITNDEGQRFFAGGVLPREECEARLRALFGVSNEQVAALGQALRGNEQAARTIASLRNFLIVEVLSFIKCFEAMRPVEDAENFYMEREWRIGRHVNFALDDVSRIFLPAEYARLFRTDLPAYAGQLSFV